MLSIIRDISTFVGGFLRDERSQMTKTGFLSVASTIAVLGIGLLPSMAHATPCGPCSDCDVGNPVCTIGDCVYYKQTCTGEPLVCDTSHGMHKVCPGVSTCVWSCN